MFVTIQKNIHLENLSVPSLKQGDIFPVERTGFTKHGNHVVIQHQNTSISLPIDLVITHETEETPVIKTWSNEEIKMSFFIHPCIKCGVYWDPQHYIQKKGATSGPKTCYCCRTKGWSTQSSSSSTKRNEPLPSYGEEVKTTVRLTPREMAMLKAISGAKKLTQNQVFIDALYSHFEQLDREDSKISAWFEVLMLSNKEKE